MWLGASLKGRRKDVYLPVFSYGAGGWLPCLLLRQGVRCLWPDEGHLRGALFSRSTRNLGFLLGDDFWIYFRVQRFLVRHWILVSSSPRRLLYSDPTIVSRPALFVAVFSALLGLQWYMLCVSLRNFTFFYVNRWITDPEVDSRLSGHALCI